MQEVFLFHIMAYYMLSENLKKWEKKRYSIKRALLSSLVVCILKITNMKKQKLLLTFKINGTLSLEMFPLSCSSSMIFCCCCRIFWFCSMIARWLTSSLLIISSFKASSAMFFCRRKLSKLYNSLNMFKRFKKPLKKYSFEKVPSRFPLECYVSRQIRAN